MTRKELRKQRNRLTELIKGLNHRQRKAVKNIDGPSLVIAGPGTGKTTVLSIRIAYILTQMLVIFYA